MLKSAFRLVRVDPDGANRNAYRLGRFLFVEFRLMLGRRGSLWWWGLVAGVIQEIHRRLSMGTVVNSHVAAVATAGVSVTERTSYAVIGFLGWIEIPPA